MKIILLGPPGAGKGTLAHLIKERFGICPIATGDILRDAMKSGSPIGQKVKKYVESGELVPDEVVTAIIENKLMTDKNIEKGYMLDGFPRTKPQAEELDRILERINRPLDCAVYMEVSLPVIIQRLTGRRVCRECGDLFHVTNKPPHQSGRCDECGGEIYQRPDDNEETIRTRMDVYLKNTAPVIGYYRSLGKLQEVDGSRDSRELLNDLVDGLNERKRTNQDKIR